MKKLVLICFVVSGLSFAAAGFLMNQAGEKEIQSFAEKIVAKHFNVVQLTPAEETIDAAGVEEIVVNSTSTDINVQDSEDDKIHVVYAKVKSEGEDVKIYHRVDHKIFFDVPDHVGENLKVNVMANNSGFNINVKESSFVLRVPKKLKMLKLTNVSGNVIMELKSNAYAHMNATM